MIFRISIGLFLGELAVNFPGGRGGEISGCLGAWFPSASSGFRSACFLQILHLLVIAFYHTCHIILKNDAPHQLIGILFHPAKKSKMKSLNC